jgi:hypothetical protein
MIAILRNPNSKDNTKAVVGIFESRPNSISEHEETGPVSQPKWRPNFKTNAQ